MGNIPTIKHKESKIKIVRTGYKDAQLQLDGLYAEWPFKGPWECDVDVKVANLWGSIRDELMSQYKAEGERAMKDRLAEAQKAVSAMSGEILKVRLEESLWKEV